MKKVYGIFGGNFDPIHYGHIYLAKKLRELVCIDKIIFLPNHYPPHRTRTQTSIVDKINMIKLAIHKYPSFQISYLEAYANHICYTVDTLKKIRKKINYSTSLCFIIGEDHLNTLHLWKNWKQILFYVHLIICPRNYKKKNQLTNFINSHIIHNFHLLHQKSFGYIFFANIPLFDVSSTQIRKNYSLKKNCNTLLPKNVNDYILLKQLYL
ncbi:nicotinate-nucleotide adenylyltransferase [Buchnera aphidicola]|uniref:Probable nicotinate-nucleotide adenylyltransferase n=1 Tax=Buchnera aphidicola subsp. Uroleucon sonchi TaxID=118118 RepID=A0A6C1FD92_BUCUN|nr:nicotinate-nucleotide adenylyltransferase [Buchnera aphidicola]QIE02136.1 nicotinate-nucleotide adenylyltransferase [Buchnera aphidicola (Uroleucon sonchi)]